MNPDSVKDGGQAIPVSQQNMMHGGPLEGFGGMTLRDYFAAKALQGMLSEDASSYTFSSAAEAAYKQADAMLEARQS